MQSVCAVVVTYNRLDMLKRCVSALEGQTAPCDVLVVDNASTDGTAQWLETRRSERLHMENTGANLGGAGGFNYGMRRAVEAGYEYLWLMDDDCLPEPEALEKLLEADALLHGKYGWLSSVALWTDGEICKMNLQKLKKSVRRHSIDKERLLQAKQATFVSLFLRAGTVRRVGLPIKEFFIWGDDIEYTRRIAVREGMPGFVVRQSQVIHAMQENTGSSIASDRSERISRYSYAYRNEAFTFRQEGIKGVCYYYAKCCLNFCRIILIAPDSRGERIRVLFGSIIKGQFFRPEIERF